MTDLTQYNSILIFGGSFDPPHRAHVELPAIAAKQVGAQVIAYLPAGLAPHKLDQVQTPAEHRLAMLRLALKGSDNTTLLTDEIDRADGQPSYTARTLEALSKRLRPGTTLRLLMGGDQLRIFDTWRSPERIIELAEPIVMVRPPDSREMLLAALPDDAARAAWAPRLIDVPQIDLSSTDIRNRVAQGLPIRDAVAPQVADYIEEHRLYRAP